MTSTVLKRVFGQLRYTMLASGIALLVLSGSLLLPNLGAITQVFGTDGIGIWAKLTFFVTLYGTLFTNFSLLSAFNLVLISFLFGINIALLVYYIRRQQIASANMTAHVTSIGGLVSGLLGIGCAACGSVILTALVGTFGASGFLILLPFHGAEFGLLGVVFLVISIRYLIRRINDPLVCRLHSSRTAPVDRA
ncbi:MAG: hypothetical protein KBC35_01320 [Candidatus Pacebacteria bacterium]|nr:hypothetical protein [Candidatus Paceibacterota bacterium]